ncbi:MAG: polysaccharide export protein [Candidatus Omnitrophica bacterium]|nr:polysaccharide export protein [Candidatus Omnitrophota bacterium]
MKSPKQIQIHSVFFAFLISIILMSVANSFAEDLSYAGNPNDLSYAANSPSSQTPPGASPLVPVGYSTGYGAQFSPYASFMQSPYSAGALQQQYMSANPGFPGIVQGAGPQPTDPYGAQEVSPFSRYSPYIEVIGEGAKYTLGIDDVVTVIVRNQPDFSGRFVVDPEGNIQYSFAGDIKAAGKTKDELRKDIGESLKKFVRYPEVAVMISDYRSKYVFVFGYVNRQGKYAMKGDQITVKEAIVAAGLPREDGSMKRVYVVRPSNLTEDGKAVSKKVNLKDLIIKGNAAEDFFLEPGDTIVVHQKYFDKFVNSFSKLVGPLFQASAVYELAYGNQDGFLN